MSAITAYREDDARVRRAGASEKPPKVKGIFNRIQLFGYQLAFGHLGKFAVIAWYYILFQTLRGQHTTIFSAHVTLPDVKGTWDHALSRDVNHGGIVHVMSQHDWNPARHIIRAVYEGIFGILLFRQIGYNPFKGRPEPNGVDRFICKHLRFIPNKHQGRQVTPLQYFFWPLTITLASIPFVLLGYGIVQGLHHWAHATWLSPHINAHPSFAAKFYAANYDAVIVGIFAGMSPFVKYVTNPVFHSNIMFFARRRLAKEGKPHFWEPPGFRLLVRQLDKSKDSAEQAQEALAAQNRLVAPILIFGWLLIVASAIGGYYIIQNVAK